MIDIVCFIKINEASEYHMLVEEHIRKIGIEFSSTFTLEGVHEGFELVAAVGVVLELVVARAAR
jgi:hypothetical protein